jgi:hypothetical protein
MAEHVLEGNTVESSYFGRQNKNGKAAYRHAVVTLTGGLPSWAQGIRMKVVTSRAQEGVTANEARPLIRIEPNTSIVSDARLLPGYIDPLAALI